MNGEKRQLHVTPDRSETDRVRYRAMGKAKEQVQKIRTALGTNAVGELKLEWKPDFVCKDADSGDIVFSIQPGGGLVADDALCAKFLAMPAREFKKLAAGSL